jgi:hypothetical protein
VNADDVLYVLSNYERIGLDELEFAVITRGYTEVVGQGRARGQIVTLTEPSCSPFEFGEVLVIAKGSGREPFGEGRKPGKYDVEYETFDDLEAAWERRIEVRGECGIHMAADAPYQPIDARKGHQQ